MARKLPTIRYTLPDDLSRALRAYCLVSRDDPADVVADAVRLHLDELAGPVEPMQAVIEEAIAQPAEQKAAVQA